MEAAGPARLSPAAKMAGALGNEAMVTLAEPYLASG